ADPPAPTSSQPASALRSRRGRGARCLDGLVRALTGAAPVASLMAGVPSPWRSQFMRLTRMPPATLSPEDPPSLPRGNDGGEGGRDARDRLRAPLSLVHVVREGTRIHEGEGGWGLGGEVCGCSRIALADLGPEPGDLLQLADDLLEVGESERLVG